MKKQDLYEGYVPPFTVSAEAINLVAEISAQIERYNGCSSFRGLKSPDDIGSPLLGSQRKL